MTGSSYQIGRVWVLVTDGPLSTPCHVWQGCVNSKGYPSRTINKQPVLGHRAAYEERHGPTPGLQIHHRCENKLCVNADHLQAVTPVQHGRAHFTNDLDRADALLADGQWWKLRDIHRALPDASYNRLRIGLGRGVQRGVVEHRGHGWYRLRGAA